MSISLTTYALLASCGMTRPSRHYAFTRIAVTGFTSDAHAHGSRRTMTRREHQEEENMA